MNSQGIVKGIPTKYRSTRFRSRLEARWAAFFDIVLWDWIYEPLDANGYIPDFLIKGNYPMFVEVGPCIMQEDYEQKAAKANANVSLLGHDLLILGVSPLPQIKNEIGADQSIGGWLGEYEAAAEGWDGEKFTGYDDHYSWAAGFWGECICDNSYGGGNNRQHPKQACHRIGIVHEWGNYSLRPCGQHQSGSFGGEVDDDLMQRIWREAGNAVQWKPSDA